MYLLLNTSYKEKMKKKKNKQKKGIVILMLMLSVLLSVFFESHLAGASGLSDMQNETKEGVELQTREPLPERPVNAEIN